MANSWVCVHRLWYDMAPGVITKMTCNPRGSRLYKEDERPTVEAAGQVIVSCYGAFGSRRHFVSLSTA